MTIQEGENFDLRKIMEESRGLESEEQCTAFYHADYSSLHDPFLFNDMELAVELVDQVRRQGGKILIFGDYDCDGLTSTALLLRFFHASGIHAEARIPNRLEEGYGLNEAAVEDIMRDPPALLITVDCGSSSAELVQKLMQAGIAVILTDHHELSQEEPRPLAFLNPCRRGERYPFKGLAGVGVALKFAMAMAERFCPETNPLPWISLAALGTVADSMPLLDENRALVRLGLDYFYEAAVPGLRLLGESLKPEIKKGEKPGTEFFSFALVPRLNAAGRMGDTEPALTLLTTDDEGEALAAAAALEEQNEERRRLEREICAEAIERIHRDDPLLHRNLILLADPAWHLGVLGIVASRLSQRFQRPTLVFGGDRAGEYRGSARSYGDFDILEAIASGREYCESFGGHRLAAGISVKEDEFEDFAAALRDYAALPRSAIESSVSHHSLCILPHRYVREESLNILNDFEPYGQANERPIFQINHLSLLNLRLVGGGEHLSVTLGLDDGREIGGIAFRSGELAKLFVRGDEVDVRAELKLHVWNEHKELQLLLHDMRFAAAERRQMEIEKVASQRWREGHPLTELEPGGTLDPAMIPSFWCFLEKILKAGFRPLDTGLIGQAFRLAGGSKISAFTVERLLELLAEMGLISLNKLQTGEVSAELCALDSSAKRPQLRAQATWKRLLAEGGVKNVG
ncbi:MAG: single-stranded-DNA-specific exonuclease RecJ [Clostridiales bacterium]|nr:single-stranded-DNA-specific exonuclease RecJ [Clostridiales bacterium]MDD7433011.1 single-stranded-DNA-specific exonuclease RecJ [Clostridiales bacterium]MDY3061962.1 single-stranded-DNA-specific exonuclease RecJ [Eubacteriales bacterium]